ncbi:uncharacterized protein LOC127094709 [Lathyrus oleraceus]|uniref:uncharacterized protein LOC127094709 n=1 Tax=Pisum sativum TaxID=3888 RepID=UPI0021D06300|nr:uncharacterized protein LOC127094709 [Pisum sativum]
MPRDFTEMVGVGVQLEEGIKEGRVASDNYASASSTKTFGGWKKKKEGDPNAASHHRPINIRQQYQPDAQAAPAPQVQQPMPSYYQQPSVAAMAPGEPMMSNMPLPPHLMFLFDPIPIPYSNLLPFLLAHNLVEKRIAPPVPDKLPRRYKPNEHCAFHSNAPGHDTENFFVFKGKVQELVRLGLIKFGDMPNVETNPFHEHGAVNMVTEDENLIMDVIKVKTLLVHVHLKVFKVSGKKKNDEVSVIVSVFKKPKAFEIFCPCREGTPSVISAKRLDIKMSAPFPYKSDKAVPWGYEPTTTMNGVEKPLVNNKVVTNIADTSGPTRSGRVFAHVNLRSGKCVVERPDKDKAPLVIPKSKPVHDVDAEEFLHMIRKSDYKGKAYINPDVTVDQFDHVVGNITSCNTLRFSDNDLLTEGKNHNNALYISMGCENDSLSHVLVDTDSSLNVMPNITLAKLSYIEANIKPSDVVVKAFHGSRRAVMGEIVLPMMVGP